MIRYPLFIILGLIPSFIWLLFYLRKDKKPEPNEMVIKIFIYGMAITVPVALIEWGFVNFLQGFELSSPIFLAIYFLIGVALVEELAKYIVIKLRILRDKCFDEPIDAMIYMVIAGLGFAAFENILILFALKQPFLVEQTLIALSGRFIGATILHALCSANIGFFLGLSFYKKHLRRRLVAMGMLISIIFHGFFNLALVMKGWPKIPMLLTLLIGLFIIVLLEFKYISKLKKHVQEKKEN